MPSAEKDFRILGVATVVPATVVPASVILFYSATNKPITLKNGFDSRKKLTSGIGIRMSNSCCMIVSMSTGIITSVS